MKKTRFIFLVGSICAFLLFLASCEKSEGEGGKASIEGMIHKIVEDGIVMSREIGGGQKEYYFERDTIPAADADVYIIYGKDTTGSFDDRTRTSFNGKYKFEYLVSGDYSVFAYNNLPNKKQTAQVYSMKIGDKGTHYVPDMYVWDGKNVGLSAIVGQIKVKYLSGEALGAAVRVYIKAVGTVGPIDDVRADDSGVFIFTKLEPNTTYDIWAESEPIKNGPIETVHAFVAVENASEIVRHTTDGNPIEITVENESGGATIVGQVNAIYGGGGNPDGTPVMGVRVYIREKGSDAILDDVRTNDQGAFVFSNLKAGVTYRVWAADEYVKDQETPEWREWTIPEENAGEILDYRDDFLLINIR